MASAIFFEEKQSNPPWMGWIVIFIGMGMLCFVLIELGKRLNDPGHPDYSGPLAGVAGVIIVIGVIAWLVFSNHLTVTIDRGGISYVLVPSFYTPKRIDADQIESYEIRKVTFAELMYATKSKRVLQHGDVQPGSKQKEICVLTGLTVADLFLRDGRHILLGTKNPDGILWALKRLQTRG